MEKTAREEYLWRPGGAYKVGMAAAALGSAAVNVRLDVLEVAGGNLLLFFGCLVLYRAAQASGLAWAQGAAWSFAIGQVLQQGGSPRGCVACLALSAALLAAEVGFRVFGGRLR